MSHKAAAVLAELRRLLQTPPAGRGEDVHLLELFLHRRDEDAFAELVRRHGPMVLGVCRRVLGDMHDADDVFQATFLVLARKADSIRKQTSLPSWLHGVAYRLSLKCLAGTQRRRERDQRFVDHGQVPRDDVGRREVRAILDEELQRLAEQQRAPLLLCYAEGKSQDAAARALGWSRGTLKRRLERGREILRARLTRRGLALAAAAAALTPTDLLAGVPPALTATTAKLASLMTGSEAVAAPAGSAKAALLAKDMVQSMFLGKVKTGAAVVALLGLLGTSAGVVVRHTLGQKPAEAPQVAEPQAKQGAPPKHVGQTTPRLDRDGEPLPEEAIARFGSTHLKHSGPIHFLRFTPDGKTLVSQGWDGVRTWEVATGRQIHQFAHENEAAALSRDGRYLATASHKAIQVREVQSGKPLHTFDATGLVPSLCFSPDGKTLAVAAGQTGSIRLALWDTRTGEQLRSWSTAGGDTVFGSALAFTPDGNMLISAQSDKTLRFWEADTGKELRQVGIAPSNLAKIALSANGSLLAVLSETRVLIIAGRKSFAMGHERENRIRIVDVASGKEVRQLAVPAKRDALGQAQGFTALAFSPDGKSLLAGGIGDSLFAWDPATGKELRRYPNGFANLGALAFGPDGNTVAAAVDDKTIRLFDLKRKRDVLRSTGHQSEPYQVSLPCNGRLAVSNAGEKHIAVWAPGSGRELRRLEGHAGVVQDCKLCADDRTLISRGSDQTVRFWDLASGKELSKLAVNGKEPWGFAVSPDGKTLAVPDTDGTIRVHDVVTGKPRWRVKGEDPWWGTAFSSDGKSLIALSLNHTARVWDAATGGEQRRFPLNPAGAVPGEKVMPQAGKYYLQYRAQVSADGKWIAYATPEYVRPNSPIVERRALFILDLTQGKVVHRLDGLKDDVWALACSADGKTLGWACRTSPTIHLLELATGKERHRLDSEGGPVVSLAFSADGKKLISGKADTTVLVWDLTGKLAAGGSWGKPLARAELDAGWSDLAGADAAKAYRTIRRLAATPAQAIPYLRARLQPVAAVGEKQVARWIADLDSTDFKTRARAARALESVEEDVAGFYRKVLEGKPSAEVKRRVQELLEKHVNAWIYPSPERLRLLRTLEVLELAGTAEARGVLEALAKGAPGGLTMTAKASLNRLANRAGAAP